MEQASEVTELDYAAVAGHLRDERSRIAPQQEEPLPRKKARRGFAAMSAEKQREIARLGGRAAHAKGTAHEFSPQEARDAGRKGGQAAQRARQPRVPA